MINDIIKVIEDALPNVIPPSIKNQVTSRFSKFDYNYTAKHSELIFHEEAFFSVKKNYLPYKVRFNFNKAISVEDHKLSLTKLWKSVFTKKNYTTPELNNISTLVEAIFEGITLDSIEFIKDEMLCGCAEEMCEHYHLTALALKKFTNSPLFVLLLLRVSAVMESFHAVLVKHRIQHLRELKTRNSRYLSIPIKEKTGSQFFGTDSSMINYALMAHKEIYTQLYNQTQEASQYDPNFSYFKKNNLEQWIRILTKRNGQKDWVRSVYD